MPEVNSKEEVEMDSHNLVQPSGQEALQQEIEALRQELVSIKDILKQFSGTFKTDASQIQTHALIQAASFPLSSIGNEGVPTNRQTDILTADRQETSQNKDILSLVESLKSDLKIKFRGLTQQEFKVFSAIYTLEEQGPVDYRILASYLGLSQSSIRDYIMKLDGKGIPVVKEKVNNKKVLLSVRNELRQLVTLDALMKIREPVFR